MNGASARRRVTRSIAVSGTVVAATVTVLALSAVPANATTISGGARTCASNHVVITESTSAGQTDHYQTISGRTFHKDFGNVSSSSPYRSWNQFFTSLQSWKVTASVLESADSRCIQAPQ